MRGGGVAREQLQFCELYLVSMSNRDGRGTAPTSRGVRGAAFISMLADLPHACGMRMGEGTARHVANQIVARPLVPRAAYAGHCIVQPVSDTGGDVLSPATMLSTLNRSSGS